MTADYTWAIAALGVDPDVVVVVRRLLGEGIPVVLLKGRSFQWFWPAGVPRPYGDVDLLVAGGRFEAAEAEIRALGYHRFVPVVDPQHAVTYVRDGHPAVDLHHTVPGVGVADDVLWSIVTEHRSILTIGGTSVPCLDQAGTAWHAVLHAAQHGVEEVKPRRDVGYLLDREDVDWPAVAELARRTGAAGVLRLGLEVDPRGPALADRLGLPEVSELARRRAHIDRPLAAFDQARGMPLRDRALLRARQVVPPTEVLRRREGVPDDAGTGQLAVAYVRRWRRLAVLGVTRLPTYIRLRWRERRDACDDDQLGD